MPSSAWKKNRLRSCAESLRPRKPSGPLPARQLFADNSEENSPSMCCAAMLKEKNALPRAELHSTIDNRDGFARARERHPDMRSAVVTAFGCVDEIISVFRDETLEKFFKIFSRRAIG